MQHALTSVDDFLRGAGDFPPGRADRRALRTIVAFLLIAGPIYGLAMGSFACDSPQRLLQSLFAAMKMPLLLFATTALCLPAFFVLNTLLGLRGDFAAALKAVLSAQATLSIALASLAPLTLVWYRSVDSYRAALLFNAAMFAIAAVAGHLKMQREYRALIARDPAHRFALRGWMATYAVVGVQMGWTLRPFIGDPEAPVRFFRDEPFSNAYIVVLELLLGR